MQNSKTIKISDLKVYEIHNCLDICSHPLDYTIKLSDGKTKFINTTVENMVNEYHKLKDKLQETNLILQMINQHRARYKKEKEQLQKQFEYDDKYNKHNES